MPTNASAARTSDILFPNVDLHHFARLERFAGLQFAKAHSIGSSRKCVGFLAADGCEMSVLEFSAKIMRAGRRHRSLIDRQLRRALRIGSRFVAPIIFKIAGRTNWRKSDKGRDRIPAANRTTSSRRRAEQKRFARFDRHPPDVDLRAKIAHRFEPNRVLRPKRRRSRSQLIVDSCPLLQTPSSND